VQIDKTASTRILEVSKFEEQDRNHIYSVIDAFIAKQKNSKYFVKRKTPTLGWGL
jgi:hypothetical protein